MQHSIVTSNPFALLMDPEAVLAAVHGSDRLGRLQSRIWRPLDKPMVPRTEADEVAIARSDIAGEAGADQHE